MKRERERDQKKERVHTRTRKQERDKEIAHAECVREMCTCECVSACLFAFIEVCKYIRVWRWVGGVYKEKDGVESFKEFAAILLRFFVFDLIL